jgi:hypothetical protein
MSDAELLEKCATTFKLFKRFADADNIRTDGKRMSFKYVVRLEADAAIDAIEKHLGKSTPGPGLFQLPTRK